ncbi:MAG: ParB/RepB/Spo0J family partition protein [Acidimicrobiia bacterium]|nr:ParB/RepB/Spo0J family partition protein [Acidimicrobiia bacterium]MYF82641.1 ParB/RepB/Spo0J family partition protein [Acidimicrobiia bacterium]
MTTRRSGLGKGLEALIPPPRRTDLRRIAISRIRANPNQPRQGFDADALETLADSIRQLGVLQPVVVRPEGPGFVLIAGERRWRAAQEAGLTELPALIRETDAVGTVTEALVENLLREDLNPLEEAAAFHQLEDEFGMTHAEIGEKVGRSRAAVTNALRLLNLAPAIQVLVASRDLSAGHARALLGLDDQALARHLADRAVSEGWSVRQLEEAVRLGKGMARDARRRRPAEPRPAVIIELENRLAEQLGTSVDIRYKKRKGGAVDGQVVLRFSGLDQLEQIYRRFFPST